MDKRQVIAAYRRGVITLQECAQILGVDSIRIMGMVNEAQQTDKLTLIRKRSANG